MRFKTEKLNFSYNIENGIFDINIEVDNGEFVGIIGPNGSGKSTLLKNIYRALTPSGGRIFLDGEDILKMSPRKLALKMSSISQENDVPFGFLTKEIVAMGRYPHKGILDSDTDEDRKIISKALNLLGMEKIASRKYTQLSGGEKQRVMIARALAQETNFLVMDEPTNHLDINYQIQILSLLKNLNMTVLSSIHDLNIASLYCDRIYAMKDGKIFSQGKPEEVLTKNLIKELYGVEAETALHPLTKKNNIVYLPQLNLKGESN